MTSARQRQLIDVAIAVALVVIASASLLFHRDKGAGEPTTLAFIVAVAAAAFVALRRWNPLAVVAVVAIGRVVVMADTSNDFPLLPAAAVALFTLARHGERRSGLMAAAAIGLVTAAAIAGLSADPFFEEFLGDAALWAVPIAVGDATRSRSDRLRQRIDSEAEARVQAERLRIARDLHDVVAHGLSTIAIQSGVAAHLLDQNPGQAKEALEIINATGKNSLEELRSMVGVLRSTDDVPLLPTPSDPNDLSDLIAAANQAGLVLSVDTVGSFPADIGDSCVVALHRIIQEALTNVARHAGTAATTLRITHGSDQVTLMVRNAAAAQPNALVDSTGVGIIGMKERAESLGGSLSAAPTDDGGFEVVALLPYSTRREASS